MIIEKIVTGSFEENCYILGCEKTREAVVIDPGDDAEEILGLLEEKGFTLKIIANTHAHIDHVGAVHLLKEKTRAEFLINKGEDLFLNNIKEQAEMFGLEEKGKPDVDRYIDDGDEIRFGEQGLKVIFTPGHSPGGVCFLAEGKVFVGDTLFAGSIGRTDLMGGSYETLITSICQKLLVLNDDVKVFPGHGPETSIGYERKYNQFLKRFLLDKS